MNWLKTALRSHHFQWAVLVIGVIIYVAISILGPFESDSVFGIDLSLFITFSFIVIIYCAIAIDFVARSLARALLRQSIWYNSVEFDWAYGPEGDVHGRHVYCIYNNSKSPIPQLPVDGLIWFRPIEKRSLYFRVIYKNGHRRHSFEETSPKISLLGGLFAKLWGQTTQMLTWSPSLVPPLSPKEEVAYQVEVITRGTELDAFGPGFTHVGFPTLIPIRDARLEARAPESYYFELADPPVSVILQTGEELNEERNCVPTPSLSTDRTKVRWHIKNPKEGRRYWINFRFRPLCENEP